MRSDVQDTLIAVLAEKMLSVPDPNSALYARRGFNLIATAYNGDQGVNERSFARKRRFTVVVLPLPHDIGEEIAIVTKRVGELGAGLNLPVPKSTPAEVARSVTIFRELRSGQTLDGKTAIKMSSESFVDGRGDCPYGRRSVAGGLVHERRAGPRSACANSVGGHRQGPYAG